MFEKAKMLMGALPDPTAFVKFVTDLIAFVSDPTVMKARTDLAAIMADPAKAAVVQDLVSLFSASIANPLPASAVVPTPAVTPAVTPAPQSPPAAA